MNEPQALDKLDKAILGRLQEDVRTTYDQLAKQVGLYRPAHCCDA